MMDRQITHILPLCDAAVKEVKKHICLQKCRKSTENYFRSSLKTAVGLEKFDVAGVNQ